MRSWVEFVAEREKTELKGKTGQWDSKVQGQNTGRICISSGTTAFGLMLTHWGLSSANHSPSPKLGKKRTLEDEEIKSSTERYKTNHVGNGPSYSSLGEQGSPAEVT